jgi:thioredoxin-related protein
MLKSVLSAFILLIVFSSIAFTQTKEYMPVTKFDPARDAAKDIEDAIAEAKKSNRRILLDVGGEWCIWCHRLDDFIESNYEIKNYLHKNYVVVKVNFSKENKNEEVLSKYPEIPGYPHFFVLEKIGKLLHSQDTGDLEYEKSYSAEKMMAFLKKWAPN